MNWYFLCHSRLSTTCSVLLAEIFNGHLPQYEVAPNSSPRDVDSVFLGVVESHWPLCMRAS